MKKHLNKGVFLAILAAALYAVNSPLSKVLLNYMPSTLMAGFLYIGAGIGMLFIALIRKIKKIDNVELKLTKKRTAIYYCNDIIRYSGADTYVAWIGNDFRGKCVAFE